MKWTSDTLFKFPGGLPERQHSRSSSLTQYLRDFMKPLQSLLTVPYTASSSFYVPAQPDTPAPVQHCLERFIRGFWPYSIYLNAYSQALLHQSRPPAVVDAYCTQYAAGRVYIIQQGAGWPWWEGLNPSG